MTPEKKQKATADAPTASEAQQLADSPTDELNDAVANITEQSQASDSLVQINFRHDDGSMVVVTSYRGSDPLVRVFDSADVPTDLVMDHLSDTERAKAIKAGEDAQAELDAARAAAAEVDEG